MHKLYVERQHTWTEKGFLRPAKYDIRERYVIEVDSAELARFLQNGGSIEQIASPEPPKVIGTTEKRTSMKSASASSKESRGSRSSKASKASKASKSAPPTGTARVYNVHLPDCSHRFNMRRNGRVNPKKVRVVLKGPHHYLVCTECQKLAGSAVPAAAVKHIS